MAWVQVSGMIDPGVAAPYIAAMALRTIIKLPDPRLRLVSAPVQAVDDAVRGLVGRHRGFGILNAIPRMPYTYDGTRVVAVPIAEDLPRTLAVGLRLRRAVLRRAVVAFAAYARDYFRTEWPAVVDAPRPAPSRKSARR